MIYDYAGHLLLIYDPSDIFKRYVISRSPIISHIIGPMSKSNTNTESMSDNCPRLYVCFFFFVF